MVISKKSKLIILKSLIAISVVAIGFSSYKIYTLKKEEIDNTQSYDKVKMLYSNSSDDSSTVEIDIDSDGDSEQVRTYLLDLYDENNDFRGWLNIPGTTIDFPVVQADLSDPYHYLNYDFYNGYNTFGCPFIGAGDDIYSNNIIIYGHHYRGGNMFTPLDGYVDQEFVNNHRYITLETLDQSHTYEVYCVFRMSMSYRTWMWDQEFDFPTEADFDAFIANCEEYNEISPLIEPEYGDHFVTLVTCNYSSDNARLVVIGCEHSASN